MEKIERETAENTEIQALPVSGLSSDEVLEKKALGQVNIVKEKPGKSYGKIIADNLFRIFNLMYLIVTVVLIFAQTEVTNFTYLLIVVPNILIAIIQEIRAKRTVEKLSVTTDPKAAVIRDGVLCEIDVSEIVLGDVIKIEMGKQVLSDAVVVSGVAEANESMLTGESNAIKKQEGDTVLAGSFLVSGSVYAKVVRVGKDNYVHKIETAAKGFKAPASNLFRDLNRLIKYILLIMVPLAVAILISNYIAFDGNIQMMLKKTAGSVIGMIPAGLYLLITVTLSVSVIILSKKRTLVQDMYSIEMLASADVLCLDKTGTITDGTMCVTKALGLSGTSDDELRSIIARIEGAEQSINNTSRALIEYFGTESVEITDRIPFSSERKYSAVSFSGGETYAIGAPHFVPCPVSAELEEKIRLHASEGERVLLVARLSEGGEGVAVGMVAIADRIRPNAKETILKFQEQGVTVKIISGDHAATVSTIASRVSVKDAEKYISCESLTDEELMAAAEEYTVFGRVTPEQKVLLVKTLKANGHTVAMTGDGVNDTLALKESNCAIAMADGSEVARKISQIVLLDSDFSALPSVVYEGRKCINNVRGSAMLYLMKTVFVVCLSLFAVCSMQGYPLEPRQMILVELFVIGISTVLLALEPNDKRIEGSFIQTVVIQSIPLAIVMLIPVFITMLLAAFGFGVSQECRNSTITLVLTAVSFINLLSVCYPFTKWRVGVCASIGFALLTTICGSLYIGYAIPSLGVSGDLLGILPAFENIFFFLGMMGVGVCLAVLMSIFRPSLERFVYRVAEKLKKENSRFK